MTQFYDKAYLIQRTFSYFQMPVIVKNDCFTLEAPQEISKEQKIIGIVKGMGFCPIINYDITNKQYVFTLAPYRMPIVPFPKQLVSTQAEKFYNDTNFKIHCEYQTSKTHHDDHYNMNKRHILDLAHGLNGEALIMGAGFCFDIPLEELLMQFDRVTLYDVDFVTMLRAIDELPFHLQQKVTLVQKDLTGMLASISDAFEDNEKRGSKTQILNEAALAISRMIDQHETVQFDRKFNFVVSSGVNSQLFSTMQSFVVTLLKKQDDPFSDFVTLPFSQTMDRLLNHVCLNHVDDLLNCTNPEGRIYYADTIRSNSFGIPFKSAVAEDLTGITPDRVIQLVPHEAITNKIKQNFDVLQEVKHWTWVKALQTATQGICSRPGTTMSVEAHFLQLRNQDL